MLISIQQQNKPNYKKFPLLLFCLGFTP